MHEASVHSNKREKVLEQAVTDMQKDLVKVRQAYAEVVIYIAPTRGGVKSRVIAPWGDVPPEFRAG